MDGRLANCRHQALGLEKYRYCFYNSCHKTGDDTWRMSDKNFYKRISQTDWYVESQKRMIVPQVQMERLAAQNADVMTTVSRVTDVECEHLLGRKSDLMLPKWHQSHPLSWHLHEFQNYHLHLSRKKIHEFVMGHFFNNYTFDLDKTLVFLYFWSF